MFPVDSGVVDAGVQFVQVTKAAAQHSRGRVSMARRNVQYLVQTISNGALWLSHSPRTLQAGLNKLLLEDKPPQETSADLFQKSELLDSYRLDFRRVRSHFSLRARNHPDHQHVDWALFVPRRQVACSLRAPLRSHTRALSGFFLTAEMNNVLIWVAGPMHVRQHREEKSAVRPWQYLFMLISSFFLFTIALWPARFVTGERACTSFSVDKSSKLSADREPEENEMYGHLRW